LGKGCDRLNLYEIYDNHHKDFLNFARSITNNHDRAFDLVQDTYVKAIENENIFDSMHPYQIKAWFFTTIKNKNIDHIRKNQRLIGFEDYHDIEDDSNFEEKIAVRSMLEKLPEKYRTMIIMKYQHNMNATEIGERLGLSPSTVRTHLSTAMGILRKNL